MNQLNQNIISSRNCVKCYKIEKKLPEKREHFQDIIFNSRVFSVWKNKHTEIKEIRPMFSIGGFDGSFRHIHPANPTIYYQSSYKITEWEKSAEPRKIVGYNPVTISNLIKNQDKHYPFELKSEKEWENILEFYRDLLNRSELIFEKAEHIQDFLKEFQRNEVYNLTNELKEVRNKYDKVCGLCFKLIEKIIAKNDERDNSWKKVERIKLLLETLAVPASVILLIIELFKKNNKTN